MSSASAIFDIIAPQYASDASKADYISFARDRTSACFFGDNKEMAVALRAAHMMALRDIAQASGGGTGEVASKREGDLAISFHKTSTQQGNGNSDLELTSYGKQLIGLMNGASVIIGVTGGLDDGCNP